MASGLERLFASIWLRHSPMPPRWDFIVVQTMAMMMRARGAMAVSKDALLMAVNGPMSGASRWM
jgi:hypothetical protein